MIFLAIEAIHPHWILFWFAIGAVAAAAISGNYSFNVQALTFFLTSLCLAYIGRPIVVRTLQPKKTKTNVENFIGRQEEVIEDIDNNKKTGAIKIYGTHWHARSIEDSITIKSGTKVEIVSFSGLTAIVKPA